MEEYLKRGLNKLYPNKEIVSLAQTDANLYRIFRSEAKNKKISNEDLAKLVGFTWERKSRYISSDDASLQKLSNEYRMSKAELAEIFGVSRQAMTARLNKLRKNANYVDWTSSEISEYETIIIEQLVQEKNNVYSDENIYLKLCSNSETVAIFIKTTEKVRCIFDIPKPLNDYLNQNNYHLYNDKDLEIIRGLIDECIVEENVVNIEEGELFSKIKSTCIMQSTNISDYIKFLGFEYSNSRFRREEKLKEILQDYIIDDKNGVHIPSNDPMHQSFANRASRAKMSLRDFVNSLGFIWHSHNPKHDFLLTFNRHKRLLQKYIVYDNHIYIHTSEPIYQTLCNYYLIKNDVSLQKIFQEMGYERIYISQLPKGFVPYRSIGENDDDLDIKEDDEFDKGVLDKIKDIQGNLDHETLELNKVKRRQDLVREMKKLYRYKCQLCDYSSNEAIPIIEMSDGRYYVELHHIIEISSIDELDHNDAIEIDTFKNAIVVCTHHHKVLHYHNGGFGLMLFSEDNGFYFQNKVGEVLKVITNKHFERLKL